MYGVDTVLHRPKQFLSFCININSILLLIIINKCFD